MAIVSHSHENFVLNSNATNPDARFEPYRYACHNIHIVLLSKIITPRLCIEQPYVPSEPEPIGLGLFPGERVVVPALRDSVVRASLLASDDLH